MKYALFIFGIFISLIISLNLHPLHVVFVDLYKWARGVGVALQGQLSYQTRFLYINRPFALMSRSITLISKSSTLISRSITLINWTFVQCQHATIGESKSNQNWNPRLPNRNQIESKSNANLFQDEFMPRKMTTISVKALSIHSLCDQRSQMLNHWAFFTVLPVVSNIFQLPQMFSCARSVFHLTY